MYMITYEYEIENIKDFELEVKPPAKAEGFFRSSGKNPLS